MNTSGRYGGQRAQLLLPPLKENDTHCVSFLFYQAGGREGAVPATLNVYVKGTNTPHTLQYDTHLIHVQVHSERYHQVSGSCVTDPSPRSPYRAALHRDLCSGPISSSVVNM